MLSLQANVDGSPTGARTWHLRINSPELQPGAPSAANIRSLDLVYSAIGGLIHANLAQSLWNANLVAGDDAYVQKFQ